MKEAADLGNTEAQMKLAGMNHLGRGGEVDKLKAAEYFTIAYGQGKSVMDASKLGSIFYQGTCGLNYLCTELRITWKRL